MQRRLKDTPNRTDICAGAQRCPSCGSNFVNDEALNAHLTFCRCFMKAKIFTVVLVSLFCLRSFGQG